MNFDKYHTWQALFLSVLLLTSTLTHAQEEEDGLDVQLSPRITLGYTFGAGVNCGIDLGVGVYRINDIMTGVNFSYYFVFIDKGSHRIKGVTLTAENKYISGKVGIGSVSRKWGLRNVNKASTPGIMVDFSASADTYKAPWIGFKGFIFDRTKWMFYELPSYTSFYGYFKTEEIEIYRPSSNSGEGQ